MPFTSGSCIILIEYVLAKKKEQKVVTEMMKKMFSFFLCLTLCLSFLPVGVMAEQEESSTDVVTDVDIARVEESNGVLTDPSKEETETDPVEAGSPPAEEVSAEQADLGQSEETSEEQSETELSEDQMETAPETPESNPDEIIVESASEPVEEQPDVSQQETETAETADEGENNSAPEKQETVAATEEEEVVFPDVEVSGETVIPGGDPDNEELLNTLAEQALQNALPGRRRLMAQKNVGGRLTGVQSVAYTELRSLIAQTAAGTLTSTKYKVDVTGENLVWTAEQLGYTEINSDNQTAAIQKAAEMSGFKLSELLNALLADCPYELYWFDKTSGVSSSYSAGVTSKRVTIKSVNYTFPVAKEYSAGNYTLNTAYIDSINNAVNTAKSIVDSASSLSDRDKLDRYRSQICSLTSYNTSAGGSGVSYGNPWQLIYVFDGNDSTKVVCEGYAKAFQYLCDLTSFTTGSITCYTVTGDVTSSLSGGAEGHMWNIVTMDDGKNYLVDVTNCDSGAIGTPDGLFLQGYDSGSVSAGYTINCNYGNWITYQYDGNSTATFSTADLTLADLDYTYSGHVHIEGDPVRENVIAATYTAAGSYDEVIKCTVCGKELSRTKKEIAKLQLDTPVLASISSSAATVTLKWNAVSGVQKYRVFRKTGNEGWRKQTDTTGLSYTDKAVTPGTSYTYTVRCVSSDGSYFMSGYDSTGKTIKAAFKLATPVMTSISNTTSGVQLKWNKVSGAEKYRVFRKTGSSGWKKLADLTGTSYTDKTISIGTTYVYTVRCVNSSGSTVMSAYDTAGKTIKADYALSRPVLASISSSGGKVTLKWNKVSGAAKYRVFRKTGSGGWKRLADVTGTSYTDKAGSYGTTYTYTVRCVSSDSKKFTSSYDGTGKTVTVSYPHAKPVLKSITASNGKVTIKWNKVAGAEKYRVFRKTEGGGWKGLANVTGTSYTDTTASVGTTYFYTIRCITANGKTYTSTYDTNGLSIQAK